MRHTTHRSYRTRIERVLTHIAGQLDSPLALGQLAQVANFSPFHFHRVFRAITGEPVGELTKRLRLERAAYRLREHGISVAQAAHESGFESAEAFSRAFRRTANMTPSAYRDQPKPPPTLAGPGAVLYCPATGAIQLLPFNRERTVDIRIESRPDSHIAFVRHLGAYADIGKAIEQLLSWAVEQGISVQDAGVFTLSYDDPTSVPVDELQSDACMEVRDDVVPADPVRLRTMPASRYAVYTFKGPYDGLTEAYQQMFIQWLPTSGEEVSDAPCVERYLNDCTALPPDQWLTDLCVPLRD